MARVLRLITNRCSSFHSGVCLSEVSNARLRARAAKVASGRFGHEQSFAPFLSQAGWCCLGKYFSNSPMVASGLRMKDRRSYLWCSQNCSPASTRNLHRVPSFFRASQRVLSCSQLVTIEDSVLLLRLDVEANNNRTGHVTSFVIEEDVSVVVVAEAKDLFDD